MMFMSLIIQQALPQIKKKKNEKNPHAPSNMQCRNECVEAYIPALLNMSILLLVQDSNLLKWILVTVIIKRFDVQIWKSKS